MTGPAVIGRVRRQYRIVIRRGKDLPDDVHKLTSTGSVYNYARTLKRYWGCRPFQDVTAQVQVREVSNWRPL